MSFAPAPTEVVSKFEGQLDSSGMRWSHFEENAGFENDAEHRIGISLERRLQSAKLARGQPHETKTGSRTSEDELDEVWCAAADRSYRSSRERACVRELVL